MTPTLGKRPRPRPPPPPPPPLSHLPDTVLLRILHHLSTPHKRALTSHPAYPSSLPPNPSQAFPLALCSRHLLQLFKDHFLSTIDAVPDSDFLSPLPRCDARFRTRDPHHLRTLAKLAGPSLLVLRLPLYDCSMEDAQWSVLSAVALHCPSVYHLTFVDSLHHTCTTPPHAQCTIFAKLLRTITHLAVYVVREASKLHTMSQLPLFAPYSLTLHQIHTHLHPAVIHLFRTRGQSIRHLTLSFEHVEPEYHPLHPFLPSFLTNLSAIIPESMPRLTSLCIMDAPRLNPLSALPGPVLSTEESRREFASIVAAVDKAKSGKEAREQETGLKVLVLERVVAELAAGVETFAVHCDEQTRVEVYLSEVLYVSPGGGGEEGEGAYFRATKLQSSCWMIKELGKEYFRRVEHIDVGVGSDRVEGNCTWYDRMLMREGGGAVKGDLESFRFLCEQSGDRVQSVIARVAMESVERANVVMTLLSSGVAYARRVERLEISGDVLKYVGLDHRLLYSVIGQMKYLRWLSVSEGTGGKEGRIQMENLPVLMRGLWMFCRRLESFKFEVSWFGSGCSVKVLREVLDGLKELERELPGLETHNLGEMLEIALRHGLEEEEYGIG